MRAFDSCVPLYCSLFVLFLPTAFLVRCHMCVCVCTSAVCVSLCSPYRFNACIALAPRPHSWRWHAHEICAVLLSIRVTFGGVLNKVARKTLLVDATRKGHTEVVECHCPALLPPGTSTSRAANEPNTAATPCAHPAATATAANASPLRRFNSARQVVTQPTIPCTEETNGACCIGGLH